MIPVSHALRFLLVAFAGWTNQLQREVIDYLKAENRVLREQLGSRRLRFTDDQRIRLATKAKRVRRHVVQQVATIVTRTPCSRGTAISSPESTTAISPRARAPTLHSTPAESSHQTRDTRQPQYA